MLEEQLVNFRYSHAFHILRPGADGLIEIYIALDDIKLSSIYKYYKSL